MLTTAAAKAAVPQARAYKLFDAGGLHLFIAPTGLKSWRLKCRRDGREQLLTLGRFPDLSLAEARVRRDAAKLRLRSGDHGGDATDMAETFEQLARRWHAHMLPRWSATHAEDVLASLVRDVFPAIGAHAPGDIAPTELLNVVRSVEARGAGATARRLRQRLSAIFGYGISIEVCTADPAAVLGRAMQGVALTQPHPALSRIEDCRALLTAAEDHGAAPVRLASRLLALTAVRLDAVRGAGWDEFEGLDGDAPLWRVPPARMKLARAKKGLARFSHLVPLSAAAVAVLRQAANMQPGDADWPVAGLVFPGRGKNSPIGENAVRALYASAGFGGRHVPHGWRASFSTILNELEPDRRTDIDRALAHAPKDKVEAAYNRAEQLDRRRALFDRWGALLAGPVDQNPIK